MDRETSNALAEIFEELDDIREEIRQICRDKHRPRGHNQQEDEMRDVRPSHPTQCRWCDSLTMNDNYICSNERCLAHAELVSPEVELANRVAGAVCDRLDRIIELLEDRA